MKNKKTRKNEEHKIQAAVITWRDYLPDGHPAKLLYAIPNGGERPLTEVRDKHGNVKKIPLQAKRLKEEGVLAGIPDMHLPVARGGYLSLYPETKTPTGVLSKAQKEIFPLLEAQGNLVRVFRTAQAGIELILWYLGL
jgi:hypothetical protein